jgi:hypothetical protein
MRKKDIEENKVYSTYLTATIHNFRSRELPKDQKTYWYKDSAIIRYTNSSHNATHVINDLGLMDLFLTRAHDEKWKTIESV